MPERALASLNIALATTADTLLAPLLNLPAVVSLLLTSLLTAALIVAVVAATTDQARVRHTKRRIYAALLEIRLFNDDPRAVLRSIRDALRENLAYLRISMVPLVLLSVPLLLLVTHLNAFYGYTGLVAGSSGLLKVEAATAPTLAGVELSLDVPEGILVETGPVRLAGEPEVLWRITPMVTGDFILRVRVGQQTIAKTVHVSDGPSRRSPVRVSPGIVRQLSHPSEPPLETGELVSAISITYDEATVDVLGARVHWTTVFLVLTLGWAMALARVLRVSL